MGIYIIFNMLTPFIDNKDLFDINQIDLQTYAVTERKENVNQASMDARIKELYVEELEKDITKKLGEQGYKVTECKVKGSILEEEESKITSIKLEVEKSTDVETRKNRRKCGK